MTAPRGTSGIEPVTAEGIHDSPPAKPPVPFTQRQLKAIADSLMFRIGATILYWIAGIELPGGINPFGFLKTWADDLAERADEAYYGAQNAQATADTAQGTATNAMQEIAILKSRLSAGGSGDWWADDMQYTNQALLPSPYVAHQYGSGAGTYGPNGNSELTWKPSGFGTRVCVYHHPDYELTSGKYGIAGVVSRRVSVDNTGGDAGLILGVVNASGNGFAVVVNSSTTASPALVRTVAAYDLTTTLTAEVTPINFAVSAGDLLEAFYGGVIGGTSQPDAIHIWRNGELVWSSTDSGITLGSSAFPLLGGFAVPGLFFTQLTPPRLGSYTFFDSDYTV